MSVQDISPDLDKLEAQLDKVEATIKPLLENISNSTQLPLVDRAKLFTLTNYALEIASLRLQGADALNHPVFTTELKRVKQYFDKIEAAENPPQPQPRTQKVDTEAATRMIKAGLSDDQALKNKLAEQIAKEKAKAFLTSIGKRRPDSEQGKDTPTPDGKSKKQKRSKQS
ncbi:Uncharacterized protein SAPIO_CDS9872 [Scedosporium apiospermum]|uniref:Exosome complex protein n=1 Tax=Pseudallescheria apiosperma TaxID=563466 RepID=A0A084FVU6_PSEDA|nr:Uncharacterized protein SAPIO_CDS9872 [Scedosporium apiospermum]KEZ39208.1 Uncharacterized protein SAPIO_CDS9872 [Scedosporium apiospermum]